VPGVLSIHYEKKPFREKVTFIGAGFEAEIDYDKNNNPIYTTTTEDGSKGVFPYDQCVDKYHHYDVYELTSLKGFDRNKRFQKEYKNNPQKWREYVQKTVPPDKILEFQRANVKSFATQKFKSVPGFVGPPKDPGTLHINIETGQIHFLNDRTNIWRSTVKYNEDELRRLVQDNDFHLFTNAGSDN